MNSSLRVALLIETSREYGRGLLRGISRFQREHGPWSIYFQPRGANEPVPTWLSTWNGDGILARIEDRRMARAIQKTGVPAVDLRFAVPNLGMPGVGVDNLALVRLALDHFLDRGFTRFAFCGYPTGDFIWMDLRAKLFHDQVIQEGYRCEVFQQNLKTGKRLTWDQDQRQLIRWIRKLEKPVAIMACNDNRGQQLLDACRRADVDVPDNISVLGVDNDEFLCGLSTPPLSSIDINSERIGYYAAEVLQSMMNGDPAPSEPVLFPAEAVIARTSTDSFAVEDEEFAAVLRYLRENACKGIRMADITKATGMERRTIERRMKATLGRSPKDELMRIKIEESRQLLARTDMSIKNIAQAAGFSNSRYFSRVFQTRVGTTPNAYRKLAQEG
ncbi:substrate-binding domain-containing protein [Blastopirellula sp. J2-11]|uniref:AraC family transcriptional regulator n=1 Tax=Blastopirellula sp. J2-11 TaxID=2943192 RepID=UPI0021C7822E|nr:xylose operon transcription regulator XylR [Blastopirellula sp. J2-11]UUO04381.1 substrate-binding domain-containing protein [Blastopirellula sp. J2-11]